MALPSLFRRQRGQEVPVRRETDPMAALRSEMDRLFDDFGRSFGLGEWPAWPASPIAAFAPSVDVDEHDDEVRITAELPGLDEKDFELSLDRDALTLRGEKRREHEEEREGRYHTERVYGTFERRIPLPCEVEADRTKAEFRKGVLHVTLPKAADARRRRVQIPVKAS